MYKADLEVIEYDKWNRKILRIYWYIALITFFTELMIFGFGRHKESNGFYLELYVIRPLIVNVLLLSILEGLYALIKKKHKERLKYLIVIGATLLVTNLVMVHYSVGVIFACFMLPIFLSELYNSKTVLWFTAILNFTLYLLVVFLFLPLVPNHQLYQPDFKNFITTIAMLICSVLFVLSALDRGREMVDSIINIHREHEELALKNFVMEFNSKMEPATGLYNHKTFHEYLQFLIEQSEHYGFPLSLAVFDIDNFKRVNDTYGHSLGDEVIKALSEIMKKNIGTDDYAARYGGEEFAIIFTDKTKEQAYEIAEKIRHQLNNTVIEAMKEERFGVSIGISEHTKGMSKHTFFSNTDAAQYRAKKTGKNKTVIYSEDMGEVTPEGSK